MDTLKTTLLHTLELAVCIGAAILIVKSLDVDSETVSAIVAILLGALAKFTRASESIPVKDYVNE